MDKVVELVGGGSVINGAAPSSFNANKVFKLLDVKAQAETGFDIVSKRGTVNAILNT